MDKFAWMGTFSGLFIRGNESVVDAYDGIFKDAAAFNKQMNLYFVSTGTEERNPKELVETLKKHGINNIVFHESQGTAHEWLTWRRAINEFAPLLFKK
jgi:enterochelin esterase family protein